jgi:hypothetical protein
MAPAAPEAAAAAAAAPAGADERAAPAVPRVGLSLAALRAFAEAHAGQEFAVCDEEEDGSTTASGAARTRPFSQLTAAQVVEAVVKPATQAHGCSYAELLTKQARVRAALGRVHAAAGAR